LCKLPAKEDLVRYVVQTPGELPWGNVGGLVSDDVEFYASGILMAAGKKKVLDSFHAMPIVKQDTNVLSVLYTGNVATVHRQTHLTGAAGCTTLISAIDVLTFNDAGKANKMEFFPSKELNTIVAEANCVKTFSSEELKSIVRKANRDGESFPWEPSYFEGFFDKDTEVISAFGKVKGLANFIKFASILQFKSFIISLDEIVTAGNIAIAQRSVWGTTKSGCTFFTRDTVKTEHSFPDGKIKHWEYLSLESNEIEKCGSPLSKTEL